MAWAVTEGSASIFSKLGDIELENGVVIGI
jgi:hypothetical protein